MSVFNIDEFKKHPGRKLILRHYRKDQPEVWAIEEAQVAIGDRLVIKVPETGYDTDEYVIVDGNEVRDRDGNLVGTVEFATEEDKCIVAETFYQDRINALRKELIQSIVDVLKSNHLQEIELIDDEQYDIPYVVWFDDDGNPYDSPVKKVSLDDDDSICLDVKNSWDNISSTLYYYDLGCMHLDWLEHIRENVLETIKFRQNGN